MTRRKGKKAVLTNHNLMNEHTFLSIINPVKDKMYRMSLRLLTSKEAAEDATQEVILKLWNLKDRIKHYANVEAFAMTVTKNYCLDQLKSKQNNNLRIVHQNYESNNISLQSEVEVNDEMEWLGRIVATLPEQQKMIFQLRDIEQYDYEEIAEIMEMNQTAIRVSLSRARKAIRENLIKNTTMELSEIEKLLERYDEGETSLAEERKLKEYFLKGDVPEHLRSYQLMFTFAAKQAGEKLENTPKISSQTRENWYTWSSIAAIFIVALGIFFFNESSQRMHESDMASIEEEIALQKAKETLTMVSQFMNEGKSDLVYLKEFNNTKNKIIQID